MKLDQVVREVLAPEVAGATQVAEVVAARLPAVYPLWGEGRGRSFSEYGADEILR